MYPMGARGQGSALNAIIQGRDDELDSALVIDDELQESQDNGYATPVSTTCLNTERFAESTLQGSTPFQSKQYSQRLD